MRTTIDLDPRVLQIARAVAHSRKVTLSRLVSDMLEDHFFPKETAVLPLGTTDLGLPAIYVGRTVTPEEVEAAIAEE
ncbi:MAG TPA: hypothetical protein PKA27_05490 [Fimbriimonadaceae bacterium]|nr:hypothetical protein [Fimbriimonadaceae bacterium]